MSKRIVAVVATLFAMLVAAAVVGAAQSLVHGKPHAAPGSGAAPADPLDPLTAGEIQTAFTTIEQAKRLAPGTFFPLVKLDEPAKSVVAAWSPGQPFPRRAFANVFDRGANQLYEAVVDLNAGKLVSWTPRPGAEPAVYLTEWTTADEIVHAYGPWKQAMRARGLDPKDVFVDVWAPGDTDGVPAPAGTRLLRALAFYGGGLPNPYDRPIEGVVITLDMNRGKVVDLVDTGIRPVNTTLTGDAASPRGGLKPLVVTQPQGPSFQLDGRNVAWQNWRFRVDYSPREGIVLHRIGYEQNGRVRPIVYRLSLSEVYVPYGIPDPQWGWRSAFDIGEYDLGQYAVEQQKNVDVPENAVFLDGVLAGDTGSAGGSYELPHAVAMYERDGGSLWQRTDPATYERDARFSRELVVKAAYFIGNYTYEEEFVFHLDGSIDVHVNATGTTLNQGIRYAARRQPLRDGRRAGDRGAEPPALPQLPRRLRRRRHRQPRARGRDPSGPERDRQRLRRRGDAAHERAVARRRPGRAPELGRRERLEDERARRADGVRARGGRHRAPALVAVVSGARAGAVRAAPVLAHAREGLGALRGRRLPEPGSSGRGPRGVHVVRERGREGRGRLVHGRAHPPPADRGVPGDVDRYRRVPDRPARLLRREPGPRRAEPGRLALGREHAAHLEAAAALAARLDGAACGGDDVLHDREPEPGAARGARRVGAPEALEEPRQVGGRHADPVVARRRAGSYRPRGRPRASASSRGRRSGSRSRPGSRPRSGASAVGAAGRRRDRPRRGASRRPGPRSRPAPRPPARAPATRSCSRARRPPCRSRARRGRGSRRSARPRARPRRAPARSAPRRRRRAGRRSRAARGSGRAACAARARRRP